MPLPAILAAIARIAGPALARVGARAAAGAAAEGAIGTAAQQAGKAAAGNAGGFVLDSTKLANARQITAALGGKVPAASTAPTAPAVAPTVPGAAGGPPPSNPATPSTPPQSGGDKSWSSRLAKKVSDIKTKVADTVSKAMSSKAPDVSEATKGMSWEQRYERLQKAGKLLEPSQVAKSIGTPNPTQQQITEKSEEHEQAANEKFNEARDKARSSVKSAAFIGAVGGPAALALAFKKATDAATAYAEGQVEASRGLARFNAQIAGAVAKFDLGDLKRNQRFANATGGSTAKLIETFGKFKDDIQPIKQVVTTALNQMAIAVLQMARFAIPFFKGAIETLPSVRRLVAIGEELERRQSSASMSDLRTGINKFLETQNKKVGGGGKNGGASGSW